MRNNGYWLLAPAVAVGLYIGGEVSTKTVPTPYGSLTLVSASLNEAEARRGRGGGGFFRPRSSPSQQPPRQQRDTGGQQQAAPAPRRGMGAVPPLTSTGMLVGGLAGLAAGYLLFSQAHGQQPINIEQMIVHGYLDPNDVPGDVRSWQIMDGKLVRENITAEALSEHSELLDYVEPMEEGDDGEMRYRLRISFEDLAALEESGALAQ
ncbi:hypothetical protein CKO15_08535 [Halorhodospira abdelmalekii]|uniref:hypothetical protein n=1 Tax=Halorhodospira abdelmalekii TaxID=421629 RepID=UPI0019044BC4|nr:hypothetical protein [Halorhodospira abdelmalekii]MBK1735328.1 hypothetical protein [Halorhodospira abdelmalekii]